MMCQHTHIERCMYIDTFISVRYGRIGKPFLPYCVIINCTIPHYTFYATALLVTNTLNILLSSSLRLRSLVKQIINARDGVKTAVQYVCRLSQTVVTCNSDGAQ